MRFRGPLHRRAEPLIRLVAGHADFFTIIDEGRARTCQVDKSCQLLAVELPAEEGSYPLLVVIGQERGKLLIREVLKRFQVRRHDARGIRSKQAAQYVPCQVEHKVFLHAACWLTVLGNNLRIRPDLPNRIRFRIDARIVLAPILEPLNRTLRVLQCGAFFDQVACRVHSETIHTHVQPKFSGIIHGFSHLGLLVIQIRHTAPERRVVETSARFIPCVLPPGSGLG